MKFNRSKMYRLTSCKLLKTTKMTKDLKLQNYYENDASLDL